MTQTTCKYKVTVAEDRKEPTMEALRAGGVEELSYLVRHTSEPCDDPYPRFVTHTWIDFSFVCTEEVYDRLKDGGTV